MNVVPQASTSELEAAARWVIACLKQFPEYADLQLLVIGGLAVRSRTGAPRDTMDIDFLISEPLAPTSVKGALHHRMPTLFKLYPKCFTYRGLAGKEIVINMVPAYMVPYFPTSAPRISAIPPGVIPYMEAKDLLAVKFWSYGPRFLYEKQEKDREDIQRLIELWNGHYPITFSDEQTQAIKEGHTDVEEGGISAQWLRTVLEAKVFVQ